MDAVLTAMPDFPGLLIGLRRRGIRMDLDDAGRLMLHGPRQVLDDPPIRVAVLWHLTELRLVVVARASRHVVGVCDRCGRWSMIRAGKTPRCRMTLRCAGHHGALDSSAETSGSSLPRVPARVD